MVGAGVFTSLGFQLNDINNTWSIIILWSLGAILALCGALSYAEIGTALKESGGEYHFLTKLMSPLVGYLSGWISITVGFAAPIALAAIALSSYTEIFHKSSVSLVAIITILLITFIHLTSLRNIAKFQIGTTGIKIVLLVIIIVFGLWHYEAQNALEWSNNWQNEIMYPGFAVAFIYVTFSYSGWNAAAYITEEIKHPNKNLPLALIGGTLLVSIMYILLNIVFLKNATLAELTGKVEIGQIVSTHIFGSVGGQMISIAIAIMLVSSMSAMIWAGPRVIFKMAEDHRLWKFLEHTNKNNIPVLAILFQTGVSIFLIITGTFEQILIYCGFLLNFFSGITVLGSFVLRRRNHASKTFKSPLFPLPQVLFIIISIWIFVYFVIQQPVESLYGFINVATGVVTYYISKSITKNA